MKDKIDMAGDVLLIKRKKFKIIKQVKALPNGNRVQLDVIVHPGAALIIPFLKQDRIIMLRQWRTVLNAYLLELPAGTLDPDESVLTCARRELAEETGYAAQKMTRLGRIYPVPGYSTEMIHIFKAEGLKPCGGRHEPDEVIQSRLFSKSDIQKLFKARRIRDAKSISALAMCGWI